MPAFEEMKEQVETYLARKAQQDIILALREKAKIERLDQPAAERPPSRRSRKGAAARGSVLSKPRHAAIRDPWRGRRRVGVGSRLSASTGRRA